MRRAARLIVAALVIAMLAWFLWQRASAPRPAATVTTLADSTRAGLKAVRLYFAAPDGDSLVSERREMVDAGNLHDHAAALVRALDRGPQGPGVAALPAGTALMHAYFDEHGLLTVDLSRAFQQGFRGGSSAEYLAIASLVRTLSTNLPRVERVRILCGGEPMTTLGGHLPLDRPIVVDHLP